MIQTKGKRDPEKEARAEKQIKHEKIRKVFLDRLEKKPILDWTKEERDVALNAMLEWWLSL